MCGALSSVGNAKDENCCSGHSPTEHQSSVEGRGSKAPATAQFPPVMAAELLLT